MAIIVKLWIFGYMKAFIFYFEETKFRFHLFLCEFDRFCLVDSNLFLKYIYSLIVFTNNITRTVASATHTAWGNLDELKQLFGNYRSFGNILIIFVIHTLLHVGKVSIR